MRNMVACCWYRLPANIILLIVEYLLLRPNARNRRELELLTDHTIPLLLKTTLSVQSMSLLLV